jgi:1-deoxy-D-xylulose-5-phosphate synthase
LIDLAGNHGLVVHLEDNGRVGGTGARLLQELNDAGVTTPFRLHGIPQEFFTHAKRAAILERIGLDAQSLARGIVEDVAALADRQPATDVIELDIEVDVVPRTGPDGTDLDRPSGSPPAPSDV